MIDRRGHITFMHVPITRSMVRKAPEILFVFDWRARHAKVECRLPASALADVLAKLATLLQ